MEALKAEARARGFGLLGIASPEPSRHSAFYESWVRRGLHGEMGYLARADAVERRTDLERTMESVRSIVVVSEEYCQPDPPGVPNDSARAVVARYARGADYHLVLKKKLLALLAWLDERVEGGVRGRPYVDTGPILERELAQRAGLGWFGRNTMLINPGRGSYFFLGVLLLDCVLPTDDPFREDRCGTCRACLDACPTGALLGRDENGAPVMDARRCVSYLTIELRGVIPTELRPGIGNRVFGCDICQEVCPWNQRFAQPSQEPAYRSREGLNGPPLVELAERLLDADEDGFRALLRGSPLRRATRSGLLRNVCVALGNWGGGEALGVLTRALGDRDPLVRGHAVWALGELGLPAGRRALSDLAIFEADPWVQEELSLALGE